MNDWPRPTLTLLMGGKDQNGSASSPYGPLKVGLVTYRTTQNRQLSELLNDLERKVKTLESRFSTDFGISLTDIEPLAVPGKRGDGTADGTNPCA